MDCSVKALHKEFMVFKTFTKMWLETKSVPDNKQYMFILWSRGKEDLHCWELFFPCSPHQQ